MASYAKFDLCASHDDPTIVFGTGVVILLVQAQEVQLVLLSDRLRSAQNGVLILVCAVR